MMAMLSNEHIFILDIDALREIVKYPDTRNLLSASAILRRLLTDEGQPLLHKVARGRDFKPRFVVAIRDQSDEPPAPAKEYGLTNLKFRWTNPSLDVRQGVPTRDLGLDAFLSEPVHQIGPTQITIKELINYVANVGGGVHQGAPRKRDEAGKIIDASSNSVIINGHPYPLASMVHIAKITVDALDPLYQRVRA